MTYLLAMDGKQTNPPEKEPHEAARDLEQKTELHMTFLPKTAETRQELLSLLIAIPLSLAGTSFLFYLLDTGARIAGV